MKALLYCTKSKKKLFYDVVWRKWMYGFDKPHDKFPSVNGTIVAECEVETEEIRLSEYPYYEDCSVGLFDTPTLTNDELLRKSCLNDDELEDYLTNEKGYALHISNLREIHPSLSVIFKEPHGFERVSKAPQNMMRVYDEVGNKYILISIRPEWLCKILNGEKTIEVRKQVLKEMIGK